MLATIPTAYANVYKCKTPDGQIQYRDTPCAGNSKEYGIYQTANVTESAKLNTEAKGHSLALGEQSFTIPTIVMLDNNGKPRKCRKQRRADAEAI